MAKKTIQKMYGRAIIQPTTLNQETREVDVVFATETPIARFGWNEDYDEILSCEDDAIRMERVNKGLPVMDCHNTYSVFNQVGRSSTVCISDQSELCARIRFSKRTNVEGLFQDIADGIVTDISVGYRVYKYIREPQGEGMRPIYRAIDWMPTEISLSPVPADINSGVRSDHAANDIEIIELATPKNNNMENQNHGGTSAADPVVEGANRSQPTVISPAPTTPPVQDLTTIRAQATQEARDRLDAILLSTRAANLTDTFAIELYTGGQSLDECRQAIIEKVIAAQSPAPYGTHDMRIGVEAIEKKRDAVQGAILHRVYPSVFKLTEQSREFRGMTLVEMSKELLSERGVSVRGLDKMDVARLVFSRTHSTSDFPLLFESTIDQLLRGDYQFAEEFWPRIARQTTANDFRAKNLYQVDSANGMKEVAEGEEIKYTTLVEGKQSIKLKSYAEGIKFTRQAFVNDDLDALSIIPSRFVKDWDEKRGDLVWSLIIDNVKMGDTHNLFSTEHKNLLTGAASALNEESLAAMLALFKKQTGIDGTRRIRVIPRLLIVPVELEVTARKLVTAITASNTKEVNVFANAFDVLVEPRLTSPVEWFLGADPAGVDGLCYAYLQGNEMLRVNSEDDFNTDTMKYAVRGDFAAAAVDHRGFAKANGKA